MRYFAKQKEAKEMPIEYTELQHESVPVFKCPRCGHTPFEIAHRGMIHSTWRRFLGKPYCCIICGHCDEVVGYERPYQKEIFPVKPPKPQK